MLKREDQRLLLEHHLVAVLRAHGNGPGDTPDDRAFLRRLHTHLPTLVRELEPLYGDRDDFLGSLASIVSTAWASWHARPADLKALDLQRESNPGWFRSQRMIGAACYADLYAGGLAGLLERLPDLEDLGITYLHVMPPFLCPPVHNDGGYAISSYRDVQPSLGTMDDLRALAAGLRQRGISLVLDFVFNHTADDHVWAKQARDGDHTFADYYWIFPDRTLPDAYERTLREIFPDEHPGAFSPLGDGRWVWTTFHRYQWDLNYANPAVFSAMAGEMLAIANVGTEVLRMDAVAFIWKSMGTSCENQPQAHNLIRAFNAVARMAAPALLFKSEAIVHPDDVVRYIDTQECQLSYNPLQMALSWEALATTEVAMLQAALAERHALPAGTSWVNYVRCHDDIGWTFADEDAARLGIRADDHRAFLNRFYVNRFPGSFARGVPFQHNPQTGDCRVSGTCASLCGLQQGDPLAEARVLLLHSVMLSTGGIPLLYLGDELGSLNDARYLDDPSKAGDSRWVHRTPFDARLFARRVDPGTPTGRIYEGLRRMIAVRKASPALAFGDLAIFNTLNPNVLGYLRGRGADRLLCVANFSPREALCDAARFAEGPARTEELLTGRELDLVVGLRLPAYGVAWLRYPG